MTLIFNVPLVHLILQRYFLFLLEIQKTSEAKLDELVDCVMNVLLLGLSLTAALTPKVGRGMRNRDVSSEA